MLTNTPTVTLLEAPLSVLTEDIEIDESTLTSAVISEPPVFDADLPPWDGATHTALVAPVEQPPAEEPDWLTIDPWTLEAIREYEARYG